MVFYHISYTYITVNKMCCVSLNKTFPSLLLLIANYKRNSKIFQFTMSLAKNIEFCEECLFDETYFDTVMFSIGIHYIY